MKRKANFQPAEKVAVAASGQTEGSLVDPRFGRCPCFLIAGAGKKELKVVDNSAKAAVRGAGVAAAQELANKGVKAVVAANVGPNALGVLQAAGIKVFIAPASRRVKEVLKSYQQGKLEPAVEAAAPFRRR